MLKTYCDYVNAIETNQLESQIGRLVRLKQIILKRLQHELSNDLYCWFCAYWLGK